MSDYTKVFDGAAKDAAQSVVAGSDFDTEFGLIQTAVNSKVDQLQGTDDLSFDMTAATRQIRGYESASYKVSMQFKADGDWVLYDDVGGASVINWDRSAAKVIFSNPIIIDGSNNYLELDTSATSGQIIFNTGTNSSFFVGSTIGDVSLYDVTNARFVWSYDQSANTFVVTSDLTSNGATLLSGSTTLNGAISGTSVKDESNMASDSATAVATQKSIKAYVDAVAAKTKSIYWNSLATTSSGSTGLSVSRISTGRYRVTHNLGHTNYAVATMMEGAAPDVVFYVWVRANTYVDIYAWDISLGGVKDWAANLIIHDHS